MANKTFIPMDNLQNISVDNCENDFFSEVYTIRPSIIIGVILSSVSICIIIPVLYSIIWYEKFGSDNKRTVLDKLAGSVCWYTILLHVLVQIPELIRYCL